MSSRNLQFRKTHTQMITTQCNRCWFKARASQGYVRRINKAQGMWMRTNEPQTRNQVLWCVMGSCKIYRWRNNQRQDHMQCERMCDHRQWGDIKRLNCRNHILHFRMNPGEYIWGSRKKAENTGYCGSSNENKQYMNRERGSRNKTEDMHLEMCRS